MIQETVDQQSATLRTAVESLRALADLALAQDDARMLALLPHVGSMATNLSRYGDVLTASETVATLDTEPAVPALPVAQSDLPSSPTPDAAAGPEAPATPVDLTADAEVSPAAAETPKPIEDSSSPAMPLGLHLVGQASEKRPDDDIAEADSQAQGHDTVPAAGGDSTEVQRGLPKQLTDKDRAMLKYLETHIGEGIAPRELMAVLPDTMTVSARRQAGRIFLSRLSQTPEYADRIINNGLKTNARRYTLLPASGISPESPADEDTDKHEATLENAAMLAETRQRERDIALLGQYDIDLSVSGRKDLSVRGIPLKLDAHAGDTLIAIARRDGRTTFQELVLDPALKDPGVTDSAPRLRKSLEQIESLMKEHGIDWRNVTVPEDGRTVRKISLGDLTQTRKLAAQTEGRHFLVQ